MKLYGLNLPGDERGWVFSTDRGAVIDAAKTWAQTHPGYHAQPRIAEIPVDAIYSYVLGEGLVPELDLVEDPTLELEE